MINLIKKCTSNSRKPRPIKLVVHQRLRIVKSVIGVGQCVGASHVFFFAPFHVSHSGLPQMFKQVLFSFESRPTLREELKEQIESMADSFSLPPPHALLPFYNTVLVKKSRY